MSAVTSPSNSASTASKIDMWMSLVRMSPHCTISHCIITYKVILLILPLLLSWKSQQCRHWPRWAHREYPNRRDEERVWNQLLRGDPYDQGGDAWYEEKKRRTHHRGQQCDGTARLVSRSDWRFKREEVGQCGKSHWVKRFISLDLMSVWKICKVKRTY